jgi:hypothetical protein
VFEPSIPSALFIVNLVVVIFIAVIGADGPDTCLFTTTEKHALGKANGKLKF